MVRAKKEHIFLTRKMLWKKHFAPTAALILQRKQYISKKRKAVFVGTILNQPFSVKLGLG